MRSITRLASRCRSVLRVTSAFEEIGSTTDVAVPNDWSFPTLIERNVISDVPRRNMVVNALTCIQSKKRATRWIDCLSCEKMADRGLKLPGPT